MTSDTIIFKADASPPDMGFVPPWKVLIVDDDLSIHEISNLVLENFVFQNRPIRCYHAHNSQECLAMLREHNDIAVILLDVVMEADDSGLRLVQKIRQELGMSAVRIVLRTGQPGQAPERKVIENYDINDYRLKTEMTSAKLQAVIVASLRSFDSIDRLSKTNSRVLNLLNKWERALDHDEIGSFMHFAYARLVELMENRPYDVFLLGVKKHEKDKLELIESSGEEAALAWAEKSLNSFSCKLQESIESSISDESVYSCLICDEQVLWVLYYRPGAQRLHEESPSQKDEGRSLLHAFDVQLRIHLDSLFLKLRGASGLGVPGIFGEFVQVVSREPGRHGQRVGAICGMLARKLGLESVEEELLRLAAPLHDVGNALLPAQLLHKKGPLSQEEREQMKLHTIGGYEFFLHSRRELFKLAGLIAREHHEAYDGSGYPDGKKGEEISLEARITKVADVFDALTHSTQYRPAKSMEEALEYMTGPLREKFDPRILTSFVDNFEQVKSMLQVYR